MRRSSAEPEGSKTGPAGRAVVRLEHIEKRYGGGAEILRDLCLVLEPGGFYVVTGASGAGKSTLLKLIYLAEPPAHGLLELFGNDTAGLDRAQRAAVRRRIGIVFQDLRLIEELSVAENIALPLRIAGVPQAEIRERAAALLRWLGLEERIDSSPTALDGGERQRVAIARAIVSRPDLLIADEPAGHVDDELAALLARVFEQVNRLGTTVLLATRDLGFANRFAHPRYHLDRGMARLMDAVAE